MAQLVEILTYRKTKSIHLTQPMSWRLMSWSISIRSFAIVVQNYHDVIMGAMASQITSLTIVYSTVYSSADRRKYKSSTSLAIVRGLHRWPVNSPHKGPATRKMFPFDDVIMKFGGNFICWHLFCHWMTRQLCCCVLGKSFYRYIHPEWKNN